MFFIRVNSSHQRHPRSIYPDPHPPRSFLPQITQISTDKLPICVISVKPTQFNKDQFVFFIRVNPSHQRHPCSIHPRFTPSRSLCRGSHKLT